MQTESEQIQRSNLQIQEQIKHLKSENFRLNATLRNNKRIMGNDLAKKQLRALIKHSDQASKLNAKLKEGDISLNAPNEKKDNKVDSMQMPYELFLKLVNFNQTMQKFDNFNSMFTYVIEAVEDIMDCQKVSLFLLNDYIQNV